MVASGCDGCDRGQMGTLQEDQGINGMPATLLLSPQSSTNNLLGLTHRDKHIGPGPALFSRWRTPLNQHTDTHTVRLKHAAIATTNITVYNMPSLAKNNTFCDNNTRCHSCSGCLGQVIVSSPYGN